MNNFIRYFFFILTLFIILLSGALFYIFNNYTINFEPLAHYNPGHPSILLDDQGNEWTRFQLDRREPIPLEQMPIHLRNAFLAAEDWQFFGHTGISFKGIIRSTVVNILHGKKMQGASTITQQLVKLLFFDSQKTYKRKIKEQLYALLAEQQFTKEQILETYLNHVYFGCGIYGVEAASQRFWGKSASSLNLDESATLAAIIRLPAQYCPILCPLSAQRRRNIILGSMKKLNFISEAEHGQAIAIPLAIKEADNKMMAPHLKELIRLQLEEIIGKEILYTGGLVIQTTLSRVMQEAAQKSFSKNVAEFKTTIKPDIDGGLLTLESATGAIKALVGGFDFNQSKFNRAWQAKRQLGSVFKPLIYAVAMEKGFSFADTAIDEPMSITQHNSIWQPNNYNNKFEGEMTLAHALVRSNNIISIKVLLQTGIEDVIALAHACHIQAVMHPYPSLALGCIDATIKEAAGMFNIFANNGIYVEPHAILWVKDEWGNKLYKKEVITQEVLPEITTAKVAKVLEFGIKRWRTAFEQELIHDEVICKTGTTNDCRTCWFAGATPELTTVVYVGADDNKSLGDVYPIKTAFPIWLDMHTALPPSGKKFKYNPQLKLSRINQWTSRYTTADDPDGIEIFA